MRAARHAWRPQPAHESVKMWKARRQSSTSAVAAGAIILSATGLSPACGKQLRQHHGPLPVRRKASARASPQHDSVVWNQAAQLSHTTPNSTTCARGSNGCGFHRRGGAALTFLQTGHMHASAERWRRRRIGLVRLRSPEVRALLPPSYSLNVGGLGYSRGSKKYIAGGDTKCCCMGRLTRLNQLKLAYFSPNIDEFSRVRVPKSGHRAQSGRTITRSCV